MADAQKVAGAGNDYYNPNTFTPQFRDALPPGTPVKIQTSDQPETGQATAAQGVTAHRNVVGLAVRQTRAGERSIVQSQGVVELPTELWDAVTGEVGGLSPGFYYYVSNLTPGVLVAVPPNTAGDWVCPVGVALSATELNVLISHPTQNPGG